MEKQRKYLTAVPVVNAQLAGKDREEYVRVLREMGAERVFIALGTNCLFADRESLLAELADNTAYFRNAGFETGCWLWAFYLTAPNDYTRMVGVTGKTSCSTVCPSDERYRDAMGEFLEQIAAAGADMIMFDDDLRYGFQDMGFGCICANHRARIEKITGRKTDAEELKAALTSGGGNSLREAFLGANGAILEDFCRDMRRHVDKVDPSVRMGFCSCITSWDIDGTVPDRLARLLAGNTVPFYRLIGAPYWAAMRNWGNRLGDVIELERAEARRRADPDIEIFSEGDTFPRPRFATPASYLECFDTALRADGKTDGILKYSLDYCAVPGYETGYFEAHTRNMADYPRIEKLFEGKTDVGVGVFERVRKYADYCIPERIAGKSDVQELAWCAGTRFLVANSVPVCRDGSPRCAVAFGDDVLAVPPDFSGGLILDAAAARILAGQGTDVGAVIEDGTFASVKEEYAGAGDSVGIFDSPDAHVLTLSPGAKARSLAYDAENARYPASYFYENADGRKFLVFAYEGYFARQGWFRSYYRAEQIRDFERFCGGEPAVLCPRHPELYILAKEGDGKLAVGLWNLCADEIYSPVVRLSSRVRSVSGLRTEASFEGNEVRLEYIPAFGFVFFEAELG